jgi:hypothetical protein
MQNPDPAVTTSMAMLAHENPLDPKASEMAPPRMVIFYAVTVNA